jgi:putative membrane protein
VLLSLPALLFTLGLFLLVINAAMLGLVALLLPGFHIAGFWTAVGGSLIVSLVSWIGSWFIGPRGRVEIIRHKRPRDGSLQPAASTDLLLISSRRFTSSAASSRARRPRT